MRRFPLLVAGITLLLLISTAVIEARDAAQPLFRGEPGRTAIFALPEADAQALPTGALALGVFPESRLSSPFLREIGFAIPPRSPGRPARPDTLMRAWNRRGTSVSVYVDPAARDAPAAALAGAFPGARIASTAAEALDADVSVVVGGTRASVGSSFEQASRDRRRILVLGVGERTPVWVSASTVPGLLTGGIARRTAIATPYDLAATLLLDRADARTTGGSVMRFAIDSDGRPKARVQALARTLDRGEEAEVPANATVSLLGIAMVIVGTVSMWRNVPSFASRIAAAAAALPLGFIAGSLMPGPLVVRLAPIPVAAILGGLTRREARARRSAVVFVVTALVAAILAVVAATWPDGAIAAGVWGNPLNSWRFFGMRNHMAAFAIGGAIVGPLMLDLRSTRAAAVLAFAGFVVGAAVFGANFVGVAVLALGGTMALLVRRYGEVRARPLLWSFGAGAAAFGLALLVDLRAPISHGGRALRTVGSDGIGAAIDLLATRVRLNEADISQFGALGWVGFVGAIVAVAGLFDWASRTPDLPGFIRGAVVGGALAAAAAFIAEDSGFFTGSILGLFPWVAFILWRTNPPRRPLDPARAGEVIQPFGPSRFGA